MSRTAIVGASGKLGFATLNALIDHHLISTKVIICTTSSEFGAVKLDAARSKGVEIRSANFDSQGSLESALQGCQKVFLISSARIEKDYNFAPPGQGREADHYRAIEAAKRAGVEHIYYTSLAFANPSASRVMTAHERTEEYLRTCGIKYTILRQGLYNESWPLYLGYYQVPDDDRSEILVGGDGKISWTSIPDLGLATAMILAAPSREWESKTIYLSQSPTYTLEEVAGIVSKVRGKEVKLKVVPRQDHEKYYVEQRGMKAPAVEWWARTYDALPKGECEIHDSTLEELLAKKGVKPTPLPETISQMLSSSVSSQ